MLFYTYYFIYLTKGVLYIMYQSFRKASMWAIIWRLILFVIALSLAFFLVLERMAGPMLPFLMSAFPFAIYVLVYWLTVRQTKKQGFSVDAVKGSFQFDKKDSLKLAGVTTVLAIFASLMFYPLLLGLSQTDLLQNRYVITVLTELLSAEGDGSWVAIAELFALAVIAAPIVEEVFFRGFVLNKWAEKYGIGKGIFWSSFFFMIVHMPSLFIPQLLVGVLCSIVYVKTKQLLYPILVHAFYNFLVLGIGLIGSVGEASVSTEQQVMELVSPSPETIQSYMIFSIICGLLLVATLILFKAYGKNITKEQTPYRANIATAEDFLQYEEERELTEEEFLAEWEAKQTVDSQEETTETE